MVNYFISYSHQPPAYIFSGEDKYENDKLFGAASGGDVWFHVDDLSSAHIYLRVGGKDSRGVTCLEEIPQELINECVQLTKANSIQGSKQPTVDIIYTMVPNLKKTAGMAPGEVSFHDRKGVKTVRAVSKESVVVKRLEKTKVQRQFDELYESKERREQEDREAEKRQKQIEKDQAEAWKVQKEALSYDRLFTSSNMTSNQCPPDDDDFM